MSRIIYPSGFDQQFTLVRNIQSKHAADGAASALKPFLIQQNIDLAADVSIMTEAATHEQNRLLLAKQSENYCELRDLEWAVVFARLKNCYQYLKIFYNPNFKALGNWGVPVDTNGKISYPADIASRISLFKMMKAKHYSFPPDESPLQPYLTQNDIDLSIDVVAVDNALDYHNRFQQATKDAEIETEKRNLLWLPVNNHIHSTGGFLKKLYNDNTKTLGLWGFVVDSSPRTPKERTSTIKPGEKIITVGVVLGSTLTNISKTDIHIYAGRNTNSKPAIVHTGEAFGITEGHSVITVCNPSLTETARLKALVMP